MQSQSHVYPTLQKLLKWGQAETLTTLSGRDAVQNITKEKWHKGKHTQQLHICIYLKDKQRGNYFTIVSKITI